MSSRGTPGPQSSTIGRGALAVTATAQRGVIPPNLAATYGGGQAQTFGNPTDYHGQAIYDRIRLPPDLIPGRTITAVGVRTAERNNYQLPCTLETAIWLYSCTTSASTMMLCCRETGRSSLWGG